MTFQGRSATSERPCMTFPIKSMEIHQRFGDHKTLMNDFSRTLRDFGAYLYDFQSLLPYDSYDYYGLFKKKRFVVKIAYVHSISMDYILSVAYFQ